MNQEEEVSSENESTKLEPIKTKIREGLIGGANDTPSEPFRKYDEPGVEFTRKQARKISFLKYLNDRGVIGGPHDSPANLVPQKDIKQRETRTDLAWRNIPLEAREAAIGKDLFEKTEGSAEKSHFTNVKKGTAEEILFRVLEKNYRDLGVEFRSNPESSEQNEFMRIFAVYMDSSKAGSETGQKITIFLQNPIIQILNGNILVRGYSQNTKSKIESELENEGKIPQNALERAIARTYAQRIEALRIDKELAQKALGAGFSVQGQATYDRKILKTQNYLDSMVGKGIVPFSDEEITSILQNFATERMSKPYPEPGEWRTIV